MRAQLSSLPPLQPANMAAVTKEAPAGSLYRRTDLLLNNLLKMSAGLRVVDITGKTTGLKKTPSDTQPNKTLK